MHFLSALWSVQKWARYQKKIKLYSSSLLLVYDARRLRTSLQSSKKSWNSSQNSNGSLTPTTPNTISLTPPNFDQQNGRISPFNYPTTATGSQSPLPQPSIGDQPPIQSYRKVQRSHSMQNNYDQDLKSIRENYIYQLDNLVSTNVNKDWAFVKMIDFAHVFPTEDDTVDDNYLFGVDNLVKMFEEFLNEAK